MKHSVYVLQEKQDSINGLKNLLGSAFEVVGESVDGQKAIDEIKSLRPDLFITELICSGPDGLAVLSALRNVGVDVKTVVVSSITRDEVIKKALALGALYYMLKPVDGKIFAERLAEIAESGASVGKARDFLSLDERISKIFISVGIPPHIKGYAYLREGVKMAVKSPDIINNITKKLYPGIGKKFDTSPSKVERAIRHAIEVAWNRGRIDSINSVFGVRAYVGSEKPTNGEFIALVADKMILEGA